MIPVTMQPEPPDFDTKVRQEGQKFLQKNPSPQKRAEWKNYECWTDALPNLRRAYNNICAYCAQWVSKPTGTPTVDHYIPIAARPDLAYEWSNYRLACLLMNSYKREHQDVLDPFNIKANWFIIDFSSYMVLPGENLTASEKTQVTATIARLKLNDDEACLSSRKAWIDEYTTGEISFSHLEKKAPFIAYELKRQGLVP
ncbi:MAG: hypothetical protein JO316_26115 [Abitibacteriaceae bacterium]|nr:hypothetical protein [Abditibacteriaceae bacterium]MBV9868836.1 hypothetical protein [Abditibacteriaceae bacterium]